MEFLKALCTSSCYCCLKDALTSKPASGFEGELGLFVPFFCSTLQMRMQTKQDAKADGD